MKKCIFMFLTLISINTLALEPSDPFSVCSRILSENLKASCISIVSKNYIDPLAAAACDRFKSATDTLKCMETIAGKIYDQRVVIACDALTQTASTLSCLNDSGNRSPDNYNQTINWVKENARYGLDQLSSGNTSEVRRTLEQLLRM